MDAINECFLRCLLARAQMDGSPPEVDVCLGRLEELVASHNYRPTAWCERVQGLKSAVSVFSTASSKPLLICLQYRVDQLLLQVTMQRLLAHPKQQRFLPPIGIPTKNLVVTDRENKVAVKTIADVHGALDVRKVSGVASHMGLVGIVPTITLEPPCVLPIPDVDLTGCTYVWADEASSQLKQILLFFPRNNNLNCYPMVST